MVLSPGSSSSNSNSAGCNEGNDNNNNNCGASPVPEMRLGESETQPEYGSSASPRASAPATNRDNMMRSETEEKHPFRSSSRDKGRASHSNRAQSNNLHSNTDFERNQMEKNIPTGRKEEVSSSSSASPSSVMALSRRAASAGRVQKPPASSRPREVGGVMASRVKEEIEEKDEINGKLVELEEDDEDEALSPPSLKYTSSSSGRIRFAAPKMQQPRLGEDSDDGEAVPSPPSLRASTSLSSFSLRSIKSDFEARPNEDQDFSTPPPALVSSCSFSRPSWYAAAQTSTRRSGDQSIESEPPNLTASDARTGRENSAVTSPPLHPSSAVSSQVAPRRPRQDLGIANRPPSRPKNFSEVEIADKAQHDPIDVDAYMTDDDSKDEEECLSKRPSTVPVPPPPPNLTRRSSNHSPISQHSKTRTSVLESERLPYVDRRRSSSSNYSGASSRDEKVPPETQNVSRTPSQEAAIAAVLGDDDQDLALKKDCVAAEELLDEELGAAIRPELRRHCDSTPGAFRAGGIGSRLESSQPPSARRTQSAAATLTRNVSFEASILQETSPSCVDDFCVDDSCTTLVSATLVTAADSCTEVETTTTNNDQINSANRRNKPDPPPVLALAEPMWKKRRVVLCLSLWALAAVGVVAICVTLALIATGALRNGDSSTGDQKEDLPQPSGVLPVVPTPSPTTETIATVMDPTERIVSSHAVSWGKISTCDDSNFFSQSDNNLLLRCGGVLELVRALENVECVTVPFQGFDDIPDESRLSCKLKVPEPELTDSGDFYREALGMVIFNCIGESDAERTATVALPTMTIENCTIASSDNSNRRRLPEVHHLSTTVSTLPVPAQKARSRALEQVQVKGGAANYVSLGRFCQEASGEWWLWHEWYTCEEGSRVLITPLGEVYDSGNDSLGSESSGGSGGGNGIFADLLGQFMNNGGNRHLLDDASATAVDGRGHRRKLQFDELIAPLYKLFDLDNFCYAIQNTDACTADAGGSVCSVTLDPVRMSDADSRSTCKSRENDGPPVDSMRTTADEEFHPQKFLDLIGKDL